MDTHGWIVSGEADVTDAQGTVHHGLLETLVVVETKSLHPATRHLPLSAESFASWGEDVDVRSFLNAIANDIVTFINFNGEVTTSRKEPDAEEIWRKAVTEDLKGFITPRLGHVKPEISKLGTSWPADDIPVGRAMKYVTAWRAIDQEALEELRFFSLAHLLEATNEMGVAPWE